MKNFLSSIFAIALILFSNLANAQDRITLVAPFPPGGPVDMLSRILADGLQKKYSQVVVVENLPGASGNLGIDKVRKAKPDGKTLLVIPAGNLTINPTLMPNFPFNIERDFVPITMLAKAPNVLVANAQSKVGNVRELIAQAKLKPNQFSYASPGIGSGLHLAGELFKQVTDTDLLHVPYKGTGPALNDVLGGSVPLMFSNLPAVLGHIRSGKLIALGITDNLRTAAAPEIPTLVEQGVSGVVVTSWYGIMAPAGTPVALVEQLARDAAEILSQANIKEQLKSQGLTDATQKPSEFALHIKQETQTWARIIKTRGILAE